MADVTGTFSSTGISDAIASRAISFELTHAGAATVALQWDLLGNGNWTTVDSAFTASVTENADAARTTPWRLYCTAHTNNVVYRLIGRE